MADPCPADIVAKAEYDLEDWHGADKLSWDEYRIVSFVMYRFRLKAARAAMRALAGVFADPVVRKGILWAANEGEQSSNSGGDAAQ